MKNLFTSFRVALIAMLSAVAESAHAQITHYLGRVGAIAYAMPSIEDFTRNRVTNPSQSEIIRQPLYDSVLYPAAGAQQLNLFSQPIGQGLTSSLGSTVGAVKNLSDTNMVLGNQLPSGQAFIIESLEVAFYPGSVSTANTYTPANASLFAVAASAAVAGLLNDVNTFYQGGRLELNVLAKNYLREQPLMKFPPKAFYDADLAISSNSATVGEVALASASAGGRPYYLEPPVTLQPAVNFECLLIWPAAVANPSGFNGRIVVSLDGFMLRASQ